MSAESFRIQKFDESGVVLLSDYEIQDAPKNVCKVRKSLGLCGYAGVTIGKPEIDGLLLVTVHCDSRRCGSDVEEYKQLLDGKAERAKVKLNDPKIERAADEHVEEWVGSSESTFTPDELQATPDVGDGANLNVDNA